MNTTTTTHCDSCGNELDTATERATGDCGYCGRTTNDNERWTIGETKRRLRAAVALLAEKTGDYGPGHRYEVQTRVIPMYARNAADAHSRRNLAGENGDDLDSFASWKGAPRFDEFRTPGAIVHIVSSETGGYGELVDVRMVWLGHGDDEPLIIDSRWGDAKTR